MFITQDITYINMAIQHNESTKNRGDNAAIPSRFKITDFI